MSQPPNDKPSLHTTPSFYGVYILQSIPKPRSMYVGSTPDPKRRLRQHNGDLKAGGAYRTKRDGSRPWKMIVLVYGFPSRVSALQFEHSLQHAYQTRHIEQESRVVSSSRQSSIYSKLANVRLLLASLSFNKMQLKVAIFDDKAFDTWNANKYNVECANLCELREFDQFCDHDVRDVDIEEPKQIILKNRMECIVCNRNIDYFPEERKPVFSTRQELTNYLALGNFPLIGICPKGDVFHLTCMARRLGDDLVPHSVICNCDLKLSWPEVVRVSTRLRQYVLED
ncbi:Structure-specific endonuclease subunit SLX1 [Candida viswanathii]|uniref:Structure-specific endonuclease subunit SLX1 n=1 Tax=Candida viswanathii TaxID=5486 RepID=A0A367YGK6_9ASCO|nr:Structure-specific endonuclease subunit SLX1 [Candida viswanathii]